MRASASRPVRVLLGGEARARSRLGPLLRQEGLETIEVEDDVGAKLIPRQTRVDLALLDLGLRQAGGMEVLQEFRRGGLKMPVLVFTDSLSVRQARAALAQGAAGYLTLELDNDDLLHTIHKMMNHITAADRETAEAKLRQSQKLETMGRLTTGVAHDLNNLMTGLLAYTDLALQAGVPAEHVAGSMLQIRRTADRMAALTKRLLSFCRHKNLQPRVLDLNGVLADMEALLRRVVREDVELVLRLDPSPCLVRLDPDQLEQLVFNLVLNASDALPRGGRISLETANVTCAGNPNSWPSPLDVGPHVRLTVRDNGIGMDPATRSRLFEPFFTTKAVGHGTGIGLSVVKEVVEQATGSIEVASEPGRGTSFQITLHRARPSEPWPLQPPVVFAPHAAGAQTILLVEDDGDIRSLLTQVLTAEGYRVLTAEHGEHALEISRRHEGPIHVLVTDVIMPRLDGRELASRMAAERPQTRVLFVTGYAGTALHDQEVASGQVPVLAKPFRIEELIQRIQELLPTPSTPIQSRRQGCA
jgi:signal transduction histidine kinase